MEKSTNVNTATVESEPKIKNISDDVIAIELPQIYTKSKETNSNKNIQVSPLRTKETTPDATNPIQKSTFKKSRRDTLRTVKSEPAILPRTDRKFAAESTNILFFDNPAFEFGDNDPPNMRLADVVKQIIAQPIGEDIHPFGRGHLYASAFYGKEHIIETGGGKYILWFVVAVLIMGLAAFIILMSEMYRQGLDDKIEVTTIVPYFENSNRTTIK